MFEYDSPVNFSESYIGLHKKNMEIICHEPNTPSSWLKDKVFHFNDEIKWLDYHFVALTSSLPPSLPASSTDKSRFDKVSRHDIVAAIRATFTSIRVHKLLVLINWMWCRVLYAQIDPTFIIYAVMVSPRIIISAVGVHGACMCKSKKLRIYLLCFMRLLNVQLDQR